MKYQIKTILSTQLGPELTKQYDALLEESKKEPMFHGSALDPNRERQVIVNDIGEVMGAFEVSRRVFEGKAYYNTNRPYLLFQFRGNGIMEEVLRNWYRIFRPGIAWIADDNIPSIRLFTKIGFHIDRAWPGKGHPGHFYFIE